MSPRLAMLRGMSAVACALLVLALSARLAHAGPRPVAPPHSQGNSSPQPDPSPGASSAKNTKTSTPLSSSRASTYTPPVPRVVATRPSVHHASVSRASTPARQGHRASPKTHRPLLAGGLLAGGLMKAAGPDVLPSVGSSSGSALLLVAGFALVLLVLAEASFLGLAGSRFGLARGRAKPQSEDDPLAIRRVELRR